jgi:Mn2+/Fe2+ NRAMP family transporter
MIAGSLDFAWHDPKYVYLVAANVGAVIMPWMVFYQQSAVVEKKLVVANLPAARLDTALGAVLTQVIMAAVLVAAAATLAGTTASGSLDTVQQIAEAITPFLGETSGRLLFGLGISGAAVVAAIVVTLTAARTLGEVLGVRHSLEDEPREAPWFYGIYTVTLVLGALLIVSGINLVRLSVGVQVMNAMLLPIVLGFLYLLARRLPGPHRLVGVYAAIVAAIVAAAVIFAVFASIAGLWN